MKITVFSKTKGFCPRCKIVRKWLKAHKVPFTEKNVYAGDNAKLVEDHNYLSAPVIVVDNWKYSFNGANMPKLMKLLKMYKASKKKSSKHSANR